MFDRFKKNIELAPYTTWKVGGRAKYFVVVDTIKQMQEIICFVSASSIPFVILGMGSNILFDDDGFDGLVILNKISFCQFNDNNISVGSGFSFSRLSQLCKKKKMSGLEFALKIPASIGGAVFMNASAHGQSVSDVIDKIEFITSKGKIIILEKNDVKFDYRFSSFHKMEGVIVSATFICIFREDVNERYEEFAKYRLKTNPKSKKTAGSVFKNPGKNIFAGALIDQCGLKGFTIGGAKVSLVHANFIENINNAKAKDILSLLRKVKDEVLSKTGIALEMEVRYIPSNGRDVK